MRGEGNRYDKLRLLSPRGQGSSHRKMLVLLCFPRVENMGYNEDPLMKGND